MTLVLTPLTLKLGWKKPDTQRKIEKAAIMVHKSINGIAPEYTLFFIRTIL